MSFDYQPVLKGNLVELRPLRREDHDDLYAVAADPLIWEQHPDKNRHEVAGFRVFFREALASGGALIAIDAATQRVIGSSRFHGYSMERSEVEIGWTFLARSHWGGTHNGELKQLMLRHAFRFVDAVVFFISPQNVRSQRAVEKIGAVLGTSPDAEGRLVYRIAASAMPAGKMHADEMDIDASLVRRLVAGQFPQWAALPIEPVPSAGTDNALYRLGDDMAVRLPRIHWAIEQVDKEQRWLAKLAPLLPLVIPVPLAKGEPSEGYPWHWSVYRWLQGENATIERIADLAQAATELAQFIADLQRIDAAGGPPPGSHNSFRGVPLAVRDTQTRAAIETLHGTLDTGAATAAWDAALQSPAWSGPPVWIHGDLQSGNLLAQRGRLSAVIDFGCLGVGDPACDLQVAWNLFSGETRDVFRAALRVDDAAWARGRGWALSVGLLQIPYYQSTNPVLAGIARYTIDEVLADHAGQGRNA